MSVESVTGKTLSDPDKLISISLDINHPLSVAIMDWDTTKGEVWLVLKGPGYPVTSHFRALLSGWAWATDSDVLTAQFETWEDYMVRRAALQGI